MQARLVAALSLWLIGCGSANGPEQVPPDDGAARPERGAAAQPDSTPPPACVEAACTRGVSCSVSIEGTGSCDDPPTGGACHCDDGAWTCYSGCAAGCPGWKPADGELCTLAAGERCRYAMGRECECYEGQWRC